MPSIQDFFGDKQYTDYNNYALAWAITYFLMKKYQEQFLKFTIELQENDNFDIQQSEMIFTRLFGFNFKDFISKFSNYINTI